MDREKVIKGIQECNLNGGLIGNCPYKGILALLKEQEAVAPVKQIEKTEWTVCGNCRNHIISRWIFCPYCGRSVKWE